MPSPLTLALRSDHHRHATAPAPRSRQAPGSGIFRGKCRANCRIEYNPPDPPATTTGTGRRPDRITAPGGANHNCPACFFAVRNRCAKCRPTRSPSSSSNGRRSAQKAVWRGDDPSRNTNVGSKGNAANAPA